MLYYVIPFHCKNDSVYIGFGCEPCVSYDGFHWTAHPMAYLKSEAQVSAFCSSLKLHGETLEIFNKGDNFNHISWHSMKVPRFWPQAKTKLGDDTKVI